MSDKLKTIIPLRVWASHLPKSINGWDQLRERLGNLRERSMNWMISVKSRKS